MGNTLKAADLHRIITDVRPFASTDKLLPALTQVRIETSSGNITAITTDRFTMGVSRADYSGEDIAANISVTNIDNLLRLAKTSRKDAPARAVDINIVGPHTLEFSFSTGESLTVQTEQTDFPRWQQLLPQEVIPGNQTADVTISYSAANLAKFAKVCGSHEMQIVNRGRHKPSIVCIGDDFVGLIMPVRAQDNSYVPASWIA